MRPLLVGEDNPLSIDPRHALYPYPSNCAGHRLCVKIMGLHGHDYLRIFDRVNLCAGRWFMKEAKQKAEQLFNENTDPTRSFVLLGTKVRDAFSIVGEPFTRVGRVVLLPHPSGRCRAWNVPGAYERARAILRDAGVLPPEDRREG